MAMASKTSPLPTTPHDNVSILLGDGTGNFSAPTNFAVGSTPFSVAVGDFNGDGKQDLAVANDSDPGNVSILLGDGAGNFSAPTNFPAGRWAFLSSGGRFQWRRQARPRRCQLGSQTTCRSCWAMAQAISALATNFAVGDNPYSVAVGDFNGDGKQDLAVANVDSDNVSILLRRVPGGESNHSRGDDLQPVLVRHR